MTKPLPNGSRSAPMGSCLFWELVPLYRGFVSAFGKEIWVSLSPSSGSVLVCWENTGIRSRHSAIDSSTAVFLAAPSARGLWLWSSPLWSPAVLLVPWPTEMWRNIPFGFSFLFHCYHAAYISDTILWADQWKIWVGVCASQNPSYLSKVKPVHCLWTKFLSLMMSYLPRGSQAPVPSLGSHGGRSEARLRVMTHTSCAVPYLCPLSFSSLFLEHHPQTVSTCTAQTDLTVSPAPAL